MDVVRNTSHAFSAHMKRLKVRGNQYRIPDISSSMYAGEGCPQPNPPAQSLPLPLMMLALLPSSASPRPADKPSSSSTAKPSVRFMPSSLKRRHEELVVPELTVGRSRGASSYVHLFLPRLASPCAPPNSGYTTGFIEYSVQS